jgi:hypothetical protein
MEWRWLVDFKQASVLEAFCEDNHSYQNEPTANKAKADGVRRPAEAMLKNDLWGGSITTMTPQMIVLQGPKRHFASV